MLFGQIIDEYFFRIIFQPKMAQPLEKLARTPMVILNSKRSIIRNLYDLMNSDILCTALT